MGIPLFARTSAKLLLGLIGGLGLASACVAQDAPANNSPLVVYHSVQGNNLGVVIDTTPRPTTYSLIGQTSDYQTSMQAWQKQAGPVFVSTNGVRIVVDPAK